VEKSFSQHHHEEARREFARMLEPLEVASRRRLGNPYRDDCFQAFEQYQEGVRDVARNVLADAEHSPLGLFVYRIKNRWHELDPLPNSSDGVRSESRPGPKRQERCDRIRAWITNVGHHYAHDPHAFAEELARFGIDREDAEHLRVEWLAGGGAA